MSCICLSRILTVSQQHQLTQAQQQVSGLEVESRQLQIQVTTLLQTKDVMQGEQLPNFHLAGRQNVLEPTSRI
jgi:hypothetical protein